MFTFEADGAEKLEEAKRREEHISRLICRCGHPARTHTEYAQTDTHRELRKAGLKRCNPGRQICPCEEFKATMTTSNRRYFLKKTFGAGPSHALGQGYITATQAGAEVEWVKGVSCDGCHTEGIPLTPLALLPSGKEVDYPTKTNVLFCDTCRNTLKEKLTRTP